MVSGPSFSPRVHPRPAYPPARRVLARWAWVLARDAILGVCLCLLAQPAYVRAFSGVRPRLVFVMTICAAHTGTYAIFNGGLFVLERLAWPPLMRCKIGRKEPEVPSAGLIRTLLTQAAVNHLITSPLSAYALYSILDLPAPDAPLPSIARLALLYVAAHTFNDFGFYWTHRMFHSKALYGRFHKQHHSFRGSVGAAAEFAGVVESIISNQIPTVGLMLIVGAHPLVQGVWLVLRLTQTYEVHSGFDFTDTLLGRLGLTANETAHHDHHHAVNLGNFGAEHTDWLFGTMDHYVAGGERKGYIAKRAELLKGRLEGPELVLADAYPAGKTE